MICLRASRTYAKWRFCRRLTNITLLEARCQVDRGINATSKVYLYTTFCEEPNLRKRRAFARRFFNAYLFFNYSDNLTATVNTVIVV